ncbi:bacteriohopanetetrol glucosamine biosynthesis glycosyltransferase HpnI [Paraburkholderia sp. MMS20-SJTR3]|uniref:Bacteriohopanetetrol glucosamine biosynthesis glycosyltransferase HpnI n=1 Tax=Paraburkholderia sejongensis TaxID=2886946 RepID=A0ABS8JP66_9BURK|nr:bacteriohopanetetrol glucosamine biosynthesis glycosyltransferase HpnI [Paraburkholderia sp. MMS20-SJTR3]MCC8391545.1 bacteriohopanetetrol glucosamine biosynthesis glycosyltransferase HpnI [Paraburkholderia sp. MMS20-SJTR3]
MNAAHLAAVTLAYACAAAAVIGIVYSVLASALIGRFFAKRVDEPASYPPVSIVKPLHGTEWTLLDNLASFCAQDYPGPVQYLFGVHDSDDPALQAVEQLRRLHPRADITVVADARLYGPNRKISNILNMLPHARHDVLVFADSDVSVAPDYLRCVVGALQKPGVGLVTCAYRGQPDPGFWPRLSAIATNYQFLPGVVIGLAFGLARPCFGQTIAMRRDTYERIGGFGPFARHLAEDYAIGEAVRALGEEVAIPPFAIAHACVETRAAQLVAHELRWSRTIRRINPLGHFGTALVHPLPFALLALAFSAGAPWAWPLPLTAFGARLALKWRTDRALRQRCRDLWLLPVWDLVAFAIFVASFRSSRVIWRGFSFKVDGDGMLSAARDE